jgi:hypothetical protein
MESRKDWGGFGTVIRALCGHVAAIIFLLPGLQGKQTHKRRPAGLTDLDGGDAVAAGLEHDADAAGRHALAEPAHDAAGHQDVLHVVAGRCSRIASTSQVGHRARAVAA